MFTSSASKSLLLAALAALPVSLLWADDNSSKLDANANSANAAGQSYEARTLITNDGDSNLINGWGVAFNPNGFVWVSDEGTGKSTLYDGNGVPQSLVVTVAAANGEDHGSPTGIVFNSSNDFAVSNEDKTLTGPARFIFATGGGLIAGWAPTVDGTHALLAYDGAPDKAAFTGITISGNGTAHVLYAADFRNGRVDMFDTKFVPMQVPGAFVDSHLPRGYSPFNVQAINGDIYVTYAKQDDDDPAEEVTGPGLGIVNVFDPNGKFARRVATKGALNAPWGITIAPASFGPFGGALLIGNLGDGMINAYGAITGAPRGALRDRTGRRIHIDGLWGLAFGNGISSQDTNALFFAAGPNDEQNGAYGVIRVRSH